MSDTTDTPTANTNPDADLTAGDVAWDLVPLLDGSTVDRLLDRAAELAAFLALAKKGRPLEPFQPPPGVARAEAEQRYQVAELERSIRHCRDVLGLGLRA